MKHADYIYCDIKEATEALEEMLNEGYEIVSSELMLVPYHGIRFAAMLVKEDE